MELLRLLRSRDRAECESRRDAAVEELTGIFSAAAWGVEVQLNFYTTANIQNLWTNELRRGVRNQLVEAGVGDEEYGEWLGDTHFLSFEIYKKTLFERYRSNAGWRIVVMGLPRAGVCILGIASHYQNAQNHNKLGSVSNLLYDYAADAMRKSGHQMYGRKISSQDWDQDGLITQPISRVAGVDIQPDHLFLKDIRTTTLKKVLASFVSVKALESEISESQLRSELHDLFLCADTLAEIHPFQSLEEFEALRALALQDLSAAGTRLLLRAKSSTRSTVRIYYGPPGTGKTLAAVSMAVKLADPAFDAGRDFSSIFRNFNDNHEQCAFVTFHPSLQYEDFVESIRPVLTSEAGNSEAEAAGGKALSAVRYEVHEGVLLKMVRRAIRHPEKEFVLVIDEINRGDMSRILGPLISSLDSDKRAGAEFPIGIELQYPMSSELETRLFMPSNLHILATMNSSDRNIALVDHALRRRFEFVRIEPEPDLLPNIAAESLSCAQLLRTINSRIEHLLDADHCIGHGYFVGCDSADKVIERVATKVIPLLREYFYGSEGLILLVLGDSASADANFFKSDPSDKAFERIFGMVKEAAATYGYRSQAVSRSLEIDPRFWNPSRLIPGPEDYQYAVNCLRKLAAPVSRSSSDPRSSGELADEEKN